MDGLAEETEGVGAAKANAPSPAHALSACARRWAGLDLVLTGLLVFPLTAHPFIDLLHAVSGEAAPTFAPIHSFLTSLSGLLGVVWALGRIASPEPSLVRLDVAGRIAVGLFVVMYVVDRGAPMALLLVTLTEFIGAFQQFKALRARAAARPPLLPTDHPA